MFFLCVQTTTKRMKVVRDVVKRAMGLAPYEKRILEVIKVGFALCHVFVCWCLRWCGICSSFSLVQTGGGNVEKRAYKMAKQRVSVVAARIDGLLRGCWRCEARNRCFR